MTPQTETPISWTRITAANRGIVSSPSARNTDLNYIGYDSTGFETTPTTRHIAKWFHEVHKIVFPKSTWTVRRTEPEGQPNV